MILCMYIYCFLGRFLSQFREGEITKFQPFSKYPPCYKDIAFWIPGNETVLVCVMRSARTRHATKILLSGRLVMKLWFCV